MFMHPITVLCSERVGIFLWFLCCGAIILVNDHCATVRRWTCTTSRECFWPSAPMSIPAIISHLCVISIPHQTNMWLWPRRRCLQSRQRESFEHRVQTWLAFPPHPHSSPQWNPLWWICNEHNLQDVILILYLSAFVCKLSIMEKKGKRILHAFVLGFVMRWLCLMFDTVFCIEKEKKYTTVDALRLCSKSFFWTAFCIFEHNCIACLAAVIDSPEVWLDVNSDLLCCFVSFLILRHLTASFWFVECMTVNALSPIII